MSVRRASATPEYAARVTESPPVRPAADGSAAAVDPWRRFDRWTSTFFVVLAVVTFIAALTVLPFAAADATVSRTTIIATVVATVLQIAVLAVASFGLDRRRPWGRTGAVGLLLVMIGADVVRVALDLARGQVTIPLAGIVALYLLTVRPGPLPVLDGRDRRIAVAILALAVVAQLAVLGPAVLGPAVLA